MVVGGDREERLRPAKLVLGCGVGGASWPGGEGGGGGGAGGGDAAAGAGAKGDGVAAAASGVAASAAVGGELKDSWLSASIDGEDELCAVADGAAIGGAGVGWAGCS